MHPIEHEGTYFKVPGIHMCEPSPQRTPLLYQAGTSERGKTFAAENAEAIFVAAPSAEILARQIADVRARAAGAGRDPYDIKWLAWASRSKLRPFVKLARTIRKHKSGVLAAIELGISNARLEALNKSRASDQPPR